MIQPKVMCERCGQPMRREGAHDKCDVCGWLTHCCEGDVCQPPPTDQTRIRDDERR